LGQRKAKKQAGAFETPVEGGGTKKNSEDKNKEPRGGLKGGTTSERGRKQKGTMLPLGKKFGGCPTGVEKKTRK